MKTPTNEHGQPLNRFFNSERRSDRDISELLGLAKGILADGKVDLTEVTLLRQWMAAHPEAVENWPCSKIAERLKRIFADGRVSTEERNHLQDLLASIVGGRAGVIGSSNSATTLPFDNPPPEIEFNGHVFVFTGQFAFGPRSACQQCTSDAGGICEHNFTKRTNYLIVGTFGSEDWIQSSYGRKIEKAMKFRDQGQRIQIIGEDHWAQSLPRTD